MQKIMYVVRTMYLKKLETCGRGFNTDIFGHIYGTNVVLFQENCRPPDWIQLRQRARHELFRSVGQNRHEH